MVGTTAIDFVLNFEIEIVLAGNIDKRRPVVTVLCPFAIDAAAVSDELKDSNRINEWGDL